MSSFLRRSGWQMLLQILSAVIAALTASSCVMACQSGMLAFN